MDELTTDVYYAYRVMWFAVGGGLAAAAAMAMLNKKHLKNVEPIRHCKPLHAHSSGVATGTVARRLRIDVHDDNDDNDNAWQRGPLWPRGMGPKKRLQYNISSQLAPVTYVLTRKTAR